jgi:hypothetical protein
MIGRYAWGGVGIQDLKRKNGRTFTDERYSLASLHFWAYDGHFETSACAVRMPEDPVCSQGLQHPQSVLLYR